MKWLFLMVFAYLVGSIPTGLVVAKLFGGQDPREAGSGNIGATNVGRVLGKNAGITTLVGDMLKGFIPAAWAAAAFQSPWGVATVGLAAFLGHLFPLYIGFRGGKGVATGFGVFLAAAPVPAILAAGIFSLVVWKWRMVSLGSLTAAASLPLLSGFLHCPLAIVLLSLAVAALTFWRHRDNIERILAGKENRLGASQAGEGLGGL